jgi:hypothetical protein
MHTTRLTSGHLLSQFTVHITSRVCGGKNIIGSSIQITTGGRDKFERGCPQSNEAAPPSPSMGGGLDMALTSEGCELPCASHFKVPSVPPF